jgi:hypothetical protein
MNKSTRISARASLAAMGQWMHRKGIWGIVEEHVKLRQKRLKYSPLEKLLNALMNILAGGHGLVEVNTRVKPDEGLQRAFGCAGCADQSVISDTLNSCTEETVEQMRQALQAVYRLHSRGYQHDYRKQAQVLDVDMSGMPAGRQGEGVTKGYFSDQKNRRGRQLGRVVATLYDEIVVERLYGGKKQLDRSLPDLVEAAEGVLELTSAKCERTIVRVDAGGGTDDDINWLLNRQYQVMVKVKHYKRSAKLCRSVTLWYPDPKVEGREVGWVEQPHPYDHPTRQLAIRNRKRNGQWSYHVIVFTLTNDQFFGLARQPVRNDPTPEQLLFAALHAYDFRSGGVETTNKGSKQGLGLTKRNKRRFAAQEVLVLLAQLAYNLIAWSRLALAQVDPRLARFGCLRFVRDLFHIPGQVILDAQGHIVQVLLRSSHPHAWVFARALTSDEVPLILGQI